MACETFMAVVPVYTYVSRLICDDRATVRLLAIKVDASADFSCLDSSLVILTPALQYPLSDPYRAIFQT